MNLQLNLALRYLSVRRLRTVLTTLAITFGVLLIFGMNSLLPVIFNVFQANALAASGQVDATITSKTGEAFSESVLAKVAAVEGVRAVSGTLERPIGLPVDYFDSDPAIPDRMTAVTLVGAEPETARSVSVFILEEGRFLEARDTDAAVITRSMAEAAGLQLGEVLRLPTATGITDLTIMGILPQRLVPGNEEILVNLPQVQNLLNMPGQINSIDANFSSSSETQRKAIEQEIKTVLGESFTIGVLQAGAEILNNIRLAQTMLNLLAGMGMLMGGFIIFNTFRTVVAERRRDIGMLRAVGASRRMVVGLILVEGLVQGLVGSAAGLLLGYAFARLMLLLIAPIGKMYLNIQIDTLPVVPSLVLFSVVIGVGITLLAGLLPAFSASRVSPLEALRPALGAVSLKRLAGIGFWSGIIMIGLAVLALVSGNASLVGLGSLLFVVGLILIAPALVNPIANLFGRLLALIFARDGTAQLAEGNLSRQPSRAAVTASTTMIALAIVVMSGSLISSITISFKDMLRKSLSSDFLILPPSLSTWGLDVGASPDLAEGLQAVEGVKTVSTMRYASTRINDLPVSLLGIQPYAYQETSGFTFLEGEPETAFREMESGRGLIINGILASNLDLQIGDTVQLLTSTGQVSYTVVGIATDYLNAKITTGYITHANIAADFGRQEDVFYQINLVEGADRLASEAAFKELLVPYPQFKLVSGQDFYEQNAGLLDSVFIGMYGMLLFLSIPSLIAMVNTLAIGVIERRREIGMLRAVGATRRQVRTIILAEALILAGLGTAFGLLAGLYLGYTTTSAMAAFGFPVEYVFSANGIIAAILGGLLFGALAAVIPARQAAGMEIVASLRYE